jgi:hypothetical protein
MSREVSAADPQLAGGISRDKTPTKVPDPICPGNPCHQKCGLRAVWARFITYTAELLPVKL